MDNEKRYGVYTVHLTIAEGKVIRCYDGNRTLLPNAREFQEKLKKVMEVLIRCKPRIFVKMYKQLLVESREFKIATKIKEDEIARLNEILKSLDV